LEKIKIVNYKKQRLDWYKYKFTLEIGKLLVYYAKLLKKIEVDFPLDKSLAQWIQFEDN
jgi:hypothetical protein